MGIYEKLVRQNVYDVKSVCSLYNLIWCDVVFFFYFVILLFGNRIVLEDILEKGYYVLEDDDDEIDVQDLDVNFLSSKV